MIKNQNNSIVAFVKWLTGKYIELERSTLPYPCKLVGIAYKQKKKLAQIQFSGQSHLIEVEVESIFEKNLFEFFSPQDKKHFFSIAYNNENLILSDRYFCPESNSEMVILTDITTGNKMTMSAYLACMDNAIIDQLNSRNAKNIAFVTGMEFGKKSLIQVEGEECL